MSVARRGELRLESEFHTIETFEADDYYLGEDIIESAGYNSIYGMNSKGEGYPAIRMNEFNTLFTDSPQQHAHNFTESDYETHKLRKDDILICRTNGNVDLVGKSALVAQDYPYVYESHLFKVRPIQKKIKSTTLTVFLHTKYGKSEIIKFSMQGNQANFSLAQFKNIRIPKFTEAFNNKIDKMVKNSFSNLRESIQRYNDAENKLLTEIGLDDFQPNEQGISIKTFKSSFLTTGRLDAEYYQPKFDEIVNRIKQSTHNSLSDLVYIDKSIEPGSRAYQESGLPFYRVSNITKFGLTEPDIHIDEHEFNNVIRPRKDTILLTKDGTVGMAYKVTDNIEGITSGAILHLNIKEDKEADILPDYLTLVLNSKVVQLQAERDAGGSIIKHWKPSEIAEVVIPVIDIETQQKISDLVQESFKLKSESEHLLEDAKKLVEYAIEHGEDKALADYELGLIN